MRVVGLGSLPSGYVTAVIPALDEEGSVGTVVSGLLAAGVDQVIVADNGSTDQTVAVATKAGALVVPAAIRGYGAACLAGLAALPPQTDAVVFCDADGADDLGRLHDICLPVLRDACDFTIGARVQPGADKRALTWPQRMGNMVASFMMRVLYRVHVSDLGPFRCISRHALDQIAMQDQNFGWTAEMQVKAYRLGLRVREVVVEPQPRLHGISKISGNWRACFSAGRIIITTILRYHRLPLPFTGPIPTTSSAQSAGTEPTAATGQQQNNRVASQEVLA